MSRSSTNGSTMKLFMVLFELLVSEIKLKFTELSKREIVVVVLETHFATANSIPNKKEKNVF